MGFAQYQLCLVSSQVIDQQSLNPILSNIIMTLDAHALRADGAKGGGYTCGERPGGVVGWGGNDPHRRTRIAPFMEKPNLGKFSL